MRYTNIIHLSDLHLKKDGVGRFNQDSIIEALGVDLHNFKDSHLKADCLVFSGDIVQAADENLFDDATNIISYLADAAGLSNDHVFMVPGNHDTSRSVIGPSIPFIKTIRDSITSADKLNEIYSNQDVIRHIQENFRGFHGMRNKFGGKYRVHEDAYIVQYYIRHLNLAIICINTAVLSGAGISTDVEDELKLSFPEMSLVRALKRTPKGAQIMLVGHHPLGFMSDVSKRYLETVYLKHVDISLSGHLHNAQPRGVASPIGSCMFAQSGSLYASRRWWNGYGIISTVPGEPHFKITYRRWHEERREFGVASELDDEGIIFSSEASRTFWSAMIPKIDRRVLEKWRIEKFIPYIASFFDEGTAGLNSENFFLPPEFERDVYVETDTGPEKLAKAEQIKFEQAITLEENLVIAASQESGKSTLIKHWANHLSNQSATNSDWSIPVVLHFSKMGSYLNRIESAVRRQLSDLPDAISFSSLTDMGLLTIFVDDADLTASNAKSALDQFISKYPKNRYILLTSTPYLQGAGIAPVISSDVPFAHLRLKHLRNSQLLTLIENHGTKDPTQADRLLQRMVQEASSLNVPITPVTGTFLIQIYTEDSSKPLINRANLIERYVEISLEKFAPADLIPSSFDYHNKADLLSFIASAMCRNQCRDIDEKEFLELTNSYFKEFGLRFSAIDILQYFVDARILRKSDLSISFRLNAFLEYFSAVRMNTDLDFRMWILDESRYLRYCDHISFYAAITRKDKEWLEELYRRFKISSSIAWADAVEDIRDATLLETFLPPKIDAEESEILAVEKRIFRGELTNKERRDALDGDGASHGITSHNTISGHVDITDPGDAWMAQLTLLSSMLKNMELIPSPIKTEILQSVIHGWLQFICLSIGIVPSLAKEKRLKFSGVEYIVMFRNDMEIGLVARRLFNHLPIAVAKIATSFLGTEKLRVQLEEGIGSDTTVTSSGQQFLRTSILAQLGVDGLSKIVEKAEIGVGDSRYLLDVLVRELSEVVVRYRLPEGELSKIRLSAANMIADLEQRRGKQAADRRTQVIQSLTSSRLLVQAGDAERKLNINRKGDVS